MQCILCTKQSAGFLCIFDDTGLRLDIDNVIRKHFWLKPEVDDPKTSAVCCTCWDAVNAFHKFYLLIEEAHAKLTSVILSVDNSAIDLQCDHLAPVIGTRGAKKELQETDRESKSKKSNRSDSESEIPLLALRRRRKPVGHHKNLSTQRQETDKTTKSNEKQISCRDFDDIIKQNINLLCNICHVQLTSFFALKEHYHSVHHQIGYVICCDKKFQSRHALAHHIVLHQNPDSFKCNTCNKVLANRKSYRNHLNTHVERVHRCDKCSKGFAKKERLERHKQVHVKPERICEQCGKVTRNLNQHQFREHSKEPRKRIQCQKCGTSLADSSSLNTHMKYQHPAKETLHVCSICGKISSTGYGLKRHIQYMHKSERRHKCPICEKAFKLAQNLRVSREFIFPFLVESPFYWWPFTGCLVCE